MAAPPAQSSFAGLPIGAKLFILLVLWTVILGLYFGVFHRRLGNDIEHARRDHALLSQELMEAQQKQQSYLKLREQVAGREALERQILRVLPEKAEIPAFLDDLNRLAELSGLRMGNVVPQPQKEDSLYVKVPVSLKIQGEYHQLAKFFYNVSRLERAIDMENIGIGTPEVVGDEVVLAVEVLATTFRRRISEGAP